MNKWQGVFAPKQDLKKNENKKQERPDKSWGVTI